MEFLKTNKRFSFKLGDKNVWDLEYKSEMMEDNGTLTAVYCFDGGLKITNVAKKYEKYGAYEWVNYIENTSDMPTEIISDLWDCNCTLPLKHDEPRKYTAYLDDISKAAKIYAPEGSNWSMSEFHADVDIGYDNSRIGHVFPGDVRRFSSHGGRSSNGNAPFFNIHKDGEGYVIAVGWTGQWNCEFERHEDDIIVRSKIEDTYFRVMPGEKFRTSSVVIMPYKGDFIYSQNKWRKLVKEHFSLVGSSGRDKYGPLCASIWGGMTSQSVLERIDAIKKNKLPFEYVWMDAGWYGKGVEPSPDEFEGDWSRHTGDWRISELIHPGKLKDVSKAVHDAGMKFLLWFEPERVIRTTPVALKHPEYFLSDNNPKSNNRLLNLGNSDAWNYFFGTISGIIEELGIDCYRQDFNFSPLAFWRKNDDADRRGITEIKHINGMYRLWDALLEKFPHLLIDNCASGGRRIDIETLRRSIPLWRSDFQCPANYDIEGAQCHNISYNTWMPYSGTGSGRPYDEYRIRSSYAASLTTNYLYSERENYCDTQEKIDFIKKYTEEYLKIRPYFSEDFYPLTEHSTALDVWYAAQFNRPAENDGVVQVFRREKSPYESACYVLKGLNSEADYLFTDADGSEFTASGKELMEKGLMLTIPEKRKAKIYFYKEI